MLPKEDNIKAVHNSLEAGITALREKVEAMAGPTVAALSKRQEEFGENVAAVKAEIETVFNKIRDALNAREDVLLGMVEEAFDGLNLTVLSAKSVKWRKRQRK